jgi:hypothetical protein
LCSENSIAILRTVDGLDAAGGIFLPLKRHINAEGLRLAIRALAVANRDLLNVAVLPKELLLSQSLEQLVLAHGRRQTRHVDEVLLDDPDADQILPVVLFSLAFLHFLLSLFGRAPLLVLLYVGSELGDPGRSDVSATIAPHVG